MDCRMQGFPVLHCLLQFAQTHAHGVGDAITLPHPLLSLLLLSSIFPSIRVFCNDLALLIWWPKYWSFSFHISPFNEYSALISFRIDWFDFLISDRYIYYVHVTITIYFIYVFYIFYMHKCKMYYYTCMCIIRYTCMCIYMWWVKMIIHKSNILQ